MQNILILADGSIANELIQRISQKRIGANYYTVVMPHPSEEKEKHAANIEMHHFDPTSRLKLSALMGAHDFSTVFVVMAKPHEGQACLENIRSVDEQVPVVILDDGEAAEEIAEHATHVIPTTQVVASRLYDHLPNVPVVAHNVGLAHGEIMEVLVPYGSSFAYRHVGSIAQVKWRIAAIYREQKQILPTSGTMIRPMDALLILGKPQVLNNIYQRISKKAGRFPEPFGRYLYLFLDLSEDELNALHYIEEALQLLELAEKTRLYIRVMHVGDFAILDTIRSYEREDVMIHVAFDAQEPEVVLLDDMIELDIGLVLMNPVSFRNPAIADEMLGQKKLVFLFGDSPFYAADHSVVLMTNEAEMESISSTLFYASETLELTPHICYYDPDGDFDGNTMIIEHYETLARIFQTPIIVEEKTLNPIRALEAMENILQIVPFTPELLETNLLSFFSTHLSDYLLRSTRHPKLLIPAETQ